MRILLASRRARRAAFLSTLAAATTLVLAAAPSHAEWIVYASGDVGFSIASAEIKGDESGGTRFSGLDTDTSPVIGGAIGLSVPMDELLPREWIGDVRLPSWPVRVEAEAVGLREYDLRTPSAGPNTRFTKIDVWTQLENFWLDVPVTAMWEPFQYLFGLGRQPRVRRWLEPADFHLGAGIGAIGIKIRGTDNAYSGVEDIVGFAWQTGAGFSYALTDRVKLTLNYRFLGLEQYDVGMSTAVGTNDGEFKFDGLVQEVRTGLRVDFYSFRNPWR